MSIKRVWTAEELLDWAEEQKGDNGPSHRDREIVAYLAECTRLREAIRYAQDEAWSVEDYYSVIQDALRAEQQRGDK